MENIVELLHRIGRLKELRRKGWIIHNVPEQESIADHTFRVSVMALLLSDKAGLNKDKCIKMALIHDLGESIIGDITPHDRIYTKEKNRLEHNAIKILFNNIDESIISLWEEYEKGESPEAKFVHELDKTEMLLQAYEYEQKYPDIDLSEFWNHVEEKVKNPQLLKILSILKKRKKYKKS